MNMKGKDVGILEGEILGHYEMFFQNCTGSTEVNHVQ
jgi:hypothetical protein